MTDSLHAVRPWLTFIGCVLVGVVLYLAQAIVVPLALAVLLAFLLTPVVAAFQRRIGRVPGVLAVAVVTFAALGAAGWVVTQQLAGVVQELPAYRQNIRQKIQDVRGAGKGGSVELLQKTVADIEAQIDVAPAGRAGAALDRPARAGERSLELPGRRRPSASVRSRRRVWWWRWSSSSSSSARSSGIA